MGKIEPDIVKGSEFEPNVFKYTSRDACLYALGIGFGQDPINKNELKFAYEGSQEFSVFPTYSINFGFGFLPNIGEIPGLEFNPMMLLHGEQYLELKSPLPTEAEVTNSARVSEVLDKKSGVLLIIDSECVDQNGDTLAYNQYKIFIRGLGGFGGEREKSQELIELPSRPPDIVEEEKTLPHQALLYRLSGDRNPLHADPELASVGGFDRPILHGLCTFGFSAKAIMKHFANYDVSKFRSMQGRFSAHVFPGETLRIKMWQENKKILFQTIVVERNEIVLRNAFVELS